MEDCSGPTPSCDFWGNQEKESLVRDGTPPRSGQRKSSYYRIAGLELRQKKQVGKRLLTH